MYPAVVVGFDAGTGALFGLAACNRSIRCWSIRPVAEDVGRELNYSLRPHRGAARLLPSAGRLDEHW